MLRKNELKQLRLQKDLLVLQSDANRMLLAAEWQRIRSPDNWLNETGNLARRHPVWTAVLTTMAGVLAVKTVRKPGLLVGGIGRLGGMGAMALSVWKMFKGKKSEP